jgi:catechol 2,3-dioxygenase-like lactoylglutathione lyase family enzyme
MGTRFDMVGIFVEDLTGMVAFYRDTLGMEIEWDGRGPYAEFKHEGIRFSMYQRDQLPGLLGQEPSYPAGLNGTFELAIDLPHSADVDVTYARVLRAGARPVYGPRDEPWGMRSSMIADPEGNLIEIGSWNRG